LSLGYGVNSYFDTLVQFIKLYALMSLINVGIIICYFSYDGMRSLSGAPLTSKLSIGNMGFSEPFCSTVNFGVQHNLIDCPYGSIQKIHSFGIHANEKGSNFTLEDPNESVFNVLKPRDKGIRCTNLEYDDCNRYMDLPKTSKIIESECIGKEACYIQDFSRFMKTDTYLKYESNYP